MRDRTIHCLLARYSIKIYLIMKIIIYHLITLSMELALATWLYLGSKAGIIEYIYLILKNFEENISGHFSFGMEMKLDI